MARGTRQVSTSRQWTRRRPQYLAILNNITPSTSQWTATARRQGSTKVQQHISPEWRASSSSQWDSHTNHRPKQQSLTGAHSSQKKALAMRWEEKMALPSMARRWRTLKEAVVWTAWTSTTTQWTAPVCKTTTKATTVSSLRSPPSATRWWGRTLWMISSDAVSTQSSQTSIIAHVWVLKRRKYIEEAQISSMHQLAMSIGQLTSALSTKTYSPSSSPVSPCSRQKAEKECKLVGSPTGRAKCLKWCHASHRKWTQSGAELLERGTSNRRWRSPEGRPGTATIITEPSTTKRGCSASRCQSRSWIWRRSSECTANRTVDCKMRLIGCSQIIRISTWLRGMMIRLWFRRCPSKSKNCKKCFLMHYLIT